MTAVSREKIVTQATFYTSQRQQWRAWLAEHFETEQEVWFVFPMKEAGEPSLSYNDAVEEALCFGWIDSTIRHTDPLHRAQRFTPRKTGSPYSRPNIERLLWLESQGLLHPKVSAAVRDLLRAPYRFPTDILDAIRQDQTAWANYQALPAPYKRIRIAYIDAARKRPAEFRKRLANFIGKTRDNKLIPGFGGVDKYYKQHISNTDNREETR